MLRSGAFEVTTEGHGLDFDLYLEIVHLGHLVEVCSTWGDLLGEIYINGCGVVTNVRKYPPFAEYDELDENGNPAPYGVYNVRTYTALGISKALAVALQVIEKEF